MVNPGNEHTDSLIDDLNFSDLEDAPGENLLVLETPLDKVPKRDWYCCQHAPRSWVPM